MGAILTKSVNTDLITEGHRQVYRRTAVDASTDFQATGRHITFEEADGWLEKLEAGQHATPPTCHV